MKTYSIKPSAFTRFLWRIIGCKKIVLSIERLSLLGVLISLLISTLYYGDMSLWWVTSFFTSQWLISRYVADIAIVISMKMPDEDEALAGQKSTGRYDND